MNLRRLDRSWVLHSWLKWGSWVGWFWRVHARGRTGIHFLYLRGKPLGVEILSACLTLHKVRALVYYFDTPVCLGVARVTPVVCLSVRWKTFLPFSSYVFPCPSPFWRFLACAILLSRRLASPVYVSLGRGEKNYDLAVSLNLGKVYEWRRIEWSKKYVINLRQL